MEKHVVEEIRKNLKKELEEFEGEKAKLRVSSDIAEQLLFNVEPDGRKTFAFPQELMQKINFEGISFDGFVGLRFDFSKYTGVSIDPQKIYNTDLRYSNLDGVSIINTFDDVLMDGAKLDGMHYKVWEEKFKKLTKSK